MFFGRREEIGRDPRLAGLRPRVFPNTGNVTFVPRERIWVRWTGGALGASGVELWTVTSTGHAIDLVSATKASYDAPVSGTLGLAYPEADLLAEPGTGALLGTARRRTHVIAPGRGLLEAMVVLLPADRLAAADPDGPPSPTAAGAVSRRADRALRETTAHLFRDLSSPDSRLAYSRGLEAAAALLIDMYLEALRAIAGEPDRTVAAASASQVRAAEAVMRAVHAEPVAMGEIARAVGVGVRALQIAFRRHRGLTPHQALSLARLEAARARLVAAAPGETVTTIALDCGFAHLGRFASAYRRMFGETPVETLRRARG